MFAQTKQGDLRGIEIGREAQVGAVKIEVLGNVGRMEVAGALLKLIDRGAAGNRLFFVTATGEKDDFEFQNILGAQVDAINRNAIVEAIPLGEGQSQLVDGVNAGRSGAVGHGFQILVFIHRLLVINLGKCKEKK